MIDKAKTLVTFGIIIATISFLISQFCLFQMRKQNYDIYAVYPDIIVKADKFIIRPNFDINDVNIAWPKYIFVEK